MKVIVIYEDNHGMIGIAKDYKNAIDFLLQENWLNSKTEVLNSLEEVVTLEELNLDVEAILEWDIEAFNDFFDGLFFLDIDTVWGM